MAQVAAEWMEAEDPLNCCLLDIGAARTSQSPPAKAARKSMRVQVEPDTLRLAWLAASAQRWPRAAPIGSPADDVPAQAMHADG